MLTEYLLQGFVCFCPESLVALHEGLSGRGKDRTAARDTTYLSLQDMETQFLFDVSQNRPCLPI